MIIRDLTWTHIRDYILQSLVKVQSNSSPSNLRENFLTIFDVEYLNAFKELLKPIFIENPCLLFKLGKFYSNKS